jgi:hypothetical protein
MSKKMSILQVRKIKKAEFYRKQIQYLETIHVVV